MRYHPFSSFSHAQESILYHLLLSNLRLSAKNWCDSTRYQTRLSFCTTFASVTSFPFYTFFNCFAMAYCSHISLCTCSFLTVRARLSASKSSRYGSSKNGMGSFPLAGTDSRSSALFVTSFSQLSWDSSSPHLINPWSGL